MGPIATPRTDPAQHHVRRLAPMVLRAAVMLWLAMSPAPARAHVIDVDGLGGDWPLVTTVSANLARIARGTGDVGEFVWKDAGADERTDFSAPDSRVDLVSARITGSAAGLSFLFQMNSIPFVSGAGAPMIQVAIDLDQVSGSGQPDMYGFAGTQVAPEAEWEYLIHTTFGSGASTARTLDATFNTQGEDLAAINTGTALIEFTIPWSRLGLVGPPTTTPIRFTIATFRSSASDDVQDIGGAGVSDALDCVTNYGDPRSSAYPNSFSELSDQVVNYAFDVWFEADGDPRAPLLLSEVMPNPIGAEPANEWIEISNPTGVSQSLDDYRIGDEENPDFAGEGMLRFPLGLGVSAGDVAVVAYQGGAFLATWGFLPDFELVTSSPIPKLVPEVLWTPSVQFQLDNVADEVLLMDRWFTIVDAIVIGSGTFPGVSPRSSPPENVSLVRTPYERDTDNGNADFFNDFTPTPGVLVFPAPNLSVSGVSAPANIRKACTPFDLGYTVTCSEVAAGPFRVGIYLSTDATVTTADLLIGQTPFASASLGDLPQIVSCVIPSGFAGLLTLGVIVDDLGQVTESDENDNVSSTNRSVQVSRVIDVADVRNDQGRSVRVSWFASGQDAENADPAVLVYELHRRIDALPQPAQTERAGPLAAQLAGWDFVASVPAHAETEYSMVVPTLGDSTGSSVVRSVFMVRAATASPAVFYDSCPDSGWSVDNLAPAAPQQLTGTFTGSATALHWLPNTEADFAFYRLHRGTSAGFVPSPADLVAEPPDTGYVDAAPASYYKLAAVDLNGNSSTYALLTPSQTVDTGDELPRVLALGAARPNPSRTGVGFSLALPVATRVRAVVFDAAGRQVGELLARELPAGEHNLSWDLSAASGGRVASGRYFLRVSAGGRNMSRAFVVLD